MSTYYYDVVSGQLYLSVIFLYVLYTTYDILITMLGSILIFLLVLSILVIVHEFGHFWVARKNGIWVEEFGFGLPPRIWGKKIGETLYSINLLPFGGFVKLHGELTDDPSANSGQALDKKRAFIYKSKKAKTAVIVAGVIMNFLLAIVAFAVVYSFSGVPRETERVKVLDVVTGSPAQTAGLMQGDVISKVGALEVKKTTDFIALVEAQKGKKVKVTLESGKELTLSPRKNPPAGEGPLGVLISTTETYFPPVWQRPFVGAYYGFKEAIFWGKAVLSGFYGIFADLFRGQAPSDVSGPVGIFAVTSEAAKTGILSLINLLGIISVNLAILNIIPFPALDGGRLLFILIEGIIGRKVLPKIEAAIHTAGMIVLLALILAITIKDIRGLIAAGSIPAFLDSLVK
jgi:regulator of sigma E protease